LTAVEINNWF